MNEQKPLLRAVNLIKIYVTGDEKLTVLKGINLSVHRGETVGVFGPSGSGKSTLLHLLGTLDRPTSGYIEIDGKGISRMGDRELSRLRNQLIGFVFQFHYLIPELNLLENVALPLLLRGQNREEAFGSAMETLRQVGLEARWKHFPDELSGGERQRGAFARAIVASPSLILADEPTGNLDMENSRKLMELMIDLNARLGTTLIVVTHNEAFRDYFMKSYHLMDGKLVPF